MKRPPPEDVGLSLPFSLYCLEVITKQVSSFSSPQELCCASIHLDAELCMCVLDRVSFETPNVECVDVCVLIDCLMSA